MEKRFWANTALCAVLGGLVVCALVNVSAAVTSKGFMVKEAEPSVLVQEMQGKVTLDGYEVGEESGRNVKSLFLVSNHSDKDVKNLHVRCDFFGEDRVELDRELWLLPEIISAGEAGKELKSSGKRFLHRDAKAVHCRIIDLQIAEAPFFTLHRSVGGGHGEATGGHGDNGHGSSAH